MFDVVILKKGLKIYINLNRGELDDPLSLTDDCKEKGHWGNGDYCITVESEEEFEYLLSLIKQSYEKNK